VGQVTFDMDLNVPIQIVGRGGGAEKVGEKDGGTSGTAAQVAVWCKAREIPKGGKGLGNGHQNIRGS